MHRRRILPIALATATIATAVPPAFANASAADAAPSRRPPHGSLRSDIVVVIDRNEGDEPVELWAVSPKIAHWDANKLDDFWEASPAARQ
jgi:hypothetical protein